MPGTVLGARDIVVNSSGKPLYHPLKWGRVEKWTLNKHEHRTQDVRWWQGFKGE